MTDHTTLFGKGAFISIAIQTKNDIQKKLN